MRIDLEAVRRAASELSGEQLVDLVVEVAQGCPCSYTACAVVIRELQEQGSGQTRMRLP